MLEALLIFLSLTFSFCFLTLKTRYPNPVVYRKFRRGSAAAKIPRKQTQDKVLPNNKAYINYESQEWSTTESEDEGHSVLHDEKGKQEPRMSIQKYSNNYSTKIRKKKSSHNDRIKANKEHGVSRSSSHVIYVKDTIETSDCNQQQRLTENLHGSCKSFIRFCSTQIICPQEDRSALAVKLYGVQAALLSSLGNPFENINP
ncbi:uncharacterized protein [Cicer arietinum]|uniref:Uncharacterized protein LOC113785670 isoform X1 n=1 Tax=Cicer arietinum TaxID=3827 RepID=A0A3Q7XMM7_CICAR|nr:uncharacterized protein LOC113785670 isoform X1 [Cicer arietinum]XP_027188088.1 uncharacterized protein LOC113785670 isoform X2 [Cicer arietinum]